MTSPTQLQLRHQQEWLKYLTTILESKEGEEVQRRRKYAVDLFHRIQSLEAQNQFFRQQLQVLAGASRATMQAKQTCVRFKLKQSKPIPCRLQISRLKQAELRRQNRSLQGLMVFLDLSKRKYEKGPDQHCGEEGYLQLRQQLEQKQRRLQAVRDRCQLLRAQQSVERRLKEVSGGELTVQL